MRVWKQITWRKFSVFQGIKSAPIEGSYSKTFIKWENWLWLFLSRSPERVIHPRCYCFFWQLMSITSLKMLISSSDKLDCWHPIVFYPGENSKSFYRGGVLVLWFLVHFSTFFFSKKWVSWNSSLINYIWKTILPRSRLGMLLKVLHCWETDVLRWRSPRKLRLKKLGFAVFFTD